ncbi:MAG: winged helix-turn-helix domain-containing protein [Anaerolineales bacterium]|nr:winged helix-turn-helix domain-containing protein [Anaerolineales bacterium]
MNTLHLRQSDYHFVIDSILTDACCSVIGLSNTGKSILLRDLALQQEDTVNKRQAAEKTFVYVDCNLMLAATDQGFYEAVIRSLRETLSGNKNNSTELLEELSTCYQKMVQTTSTFMVPLSFNDAIMRTCQALPDGIVILLDEFDQAYATLPSRVFLNLRALRDKYMGRLTYVTATVQPLRDIRSDPDADEFCELFTHHERHLGMLSRPDAMAFLTNRAKGSGVELDAQEIDFVWRQAGGHPGLLEAVAQLLIKLEVGAPELYRQQGFNLVNHQLDESEVAQAECFKLWHQLDDSEQKELLQYVTEGKTALSSQVQSSLVQKGILTAAEGCRFFSERFAAFVRRRHRTEVDYHEGIWLDVDAGDVWVDGRKMDTLTELEYRLLQTLYGRLDKLCDKYLIVESVWGQEYIDTVDDARIEKLISRLRNKIEPEPSNPRYLQTVRGRGYKLVEHSSTV